MMVNTCWRVLFRFAALRGSGLPLCECLCCSGFVVVSGRCEATEAVAVALAGLRSAVAGVDLSVVDEEAVLLGLLAQPRRAQRSLDGLVMGIGVRCAQLASAGCAAPAEDVLRGGGAVGSRQARRDAERAVVAGSIDGLGEAVSCGAVSGEHVDSIARHAAKLDEVQRAGFDFAELVSRAEDLPVETFDRFVKRRVEAVTADHGLSDTKAKQAASEFRHWFDTSTGMGRFSGSLDPERYEALAGAIEQHMTAIASSAAEPMVKNHNLAAQALVELVTSTGGRDSRNRLPYLTVIVDHDTITHGPHDESIRQTENGCDVAPETVARLCCDAVVRRVTLDATGVPVNVGRKYRTATDAQWAAIKTMHSCCAWDGCDAPISWCQAHHIREWEHGGRTDLDNLVPLCSRHHHRVHEGQWHIKLLPDRTLKIYRPDGTHHATVPTPQRC